MFCWEKKADTKEKQYEKAKEGLIQATKKLIELGCPEHTINAIVTGAFDQANIEKREKDREVPLP